MNMPYRKGGHWPPAQNVNHIVHSPSFILHSQLLPALCTNYPFTNAFLLCIITVSYTHLDVYKRQGSYNDGEKSYPVKAGDVTFCPDGTGHALDNTGDTDLVFMALIIMKSVSYTHLDVYKRQVLPRPLTVFRTMQVGTPLVS